MASNAKKKTVGTVADALPVTLTPTILTSKRMWVSLVSNIVKLVFLILGLDMTDDMELKMVDSAMVYGALAAQLIEFAALYYTKYLDEKKK